MSELPAVSVILPTYNERASLVRLDPELQEVLAPLSAEVIVVDDASPDGTAQWVRAVGGPVPHRVLERDGERGLASAVLAGFALTRGPIVVVMDADGSHDPRTIPGMVDLVRTHRAEFVLASRWVSGSSSTGLAGSRRVISAGAKLLAWPLVNLTDPMSGFFAVRRDVVGRSPLTPRGYKIALEILARCRPHPVVEVPYRFRPRYAGESKLGRGEIREYLGQLVSLYRARLGLAGRTASSTR